MENEHKGRFTVEDIRELFHLFLEITDKTHLSAADQAKLDALESKLKANDPAVAEALKP